MTLAATHRSGKSYREENFPVASRLLKAEHRPPIMAFYEFVRTADDVADHPTLPPAEKLKLLDELEDTLLGRSDSQPEAVALRGLLAEHCLGNVHAREMLVAFRQDVTKLRYGSWDELMDYCRYSAMPVGRFVLDVCGEPRFTWPAADALCAALQVINHLQDCAKDYRDLDRVYLPLDILSSCGARVEALASPVCGTGLRRCLDALCDRVEQLLVRSEGLAGQVRHPRLAMEIAVIHRLAKRLVHLLRVNDPLSGPVRLSALQSAGIALMGILHASAIRLTAGGGPHGSHVEATGDEVNPAGAARIASGSSFYTAMRLLPARQRRAVFEIYAFCRAVDDIADGDGDRRERLEKLEAWRQRIHALYDGRPTADCADLAVAVGEFSLKREDFLAVIEGMEMDAASDIRAPAFETLDLYCDRVASAVGRLCVRVFGMGEGEGVALAHHLGRALQLTNILRDLDEDAAIGRLYLPREALREAGIVTDDPREVLKQPGLFAACEQLAERAAGHFAEAEKIMAAAPRAAVRAPRIMAGAYRTILEDLVRRGWSAPRERPHLNRARLLRIALRSMVA